MMTTTVQYVIVAIISGREQVQESFPGSISPSLPVATRRSSRSVQ